MITIDEMNNITWFLGDTDVIVVYGLEEGTDTTVVFGVLSNTDGTVFRQILVESEGATSVQMELNDTTLAGIQKGGYFYGIKVQIGNSIQTVIPASVESSLPVFHVLDRVANVN